MIFLDTAEYSRRPWKGQRYEDGSNRPGGRLLIVGESHYHRCRPDCTTQTHANLTVNTIQDVVDGDFRHAFFTKVAGLFQQSKDVSGFWKEVAFYNFLQELFEGPRRPVSKEMRLNCENQALFFEILHSLKPDHVLVLGKANWGALPSRPNPKEPVVCKESRLKLELPGGLHEDDVIAYWYPTGGSSWALIGAIQHPSSFGFSARRLCGWIERFRNYPSTPTESY